MRPIAFYWRWSGDVPPPADQAVLEHWGNGQYAVTAPSSGRDWTSNPDWYLPIPPAPGAASHSVKSDARLEDDARAKACAVGYEYAEKHLAHCANSRVSVDLLGMRTRMPSAEYEGFLVAIAAYLSQAILTGRVPPAAEWNSAYPTLVFQPSADVDGEKF